MYLLIKIIKIKFVLFFIYFMPECGAKKDIRSSLNLGPILVYVHLWDTNTEHNRK